MGRIRTIKPEVLLDRKAATLSNEAWRLWVSCWVIADDCGRLPADPKLLAGQVFWAHENPFDEASRALASLRESSMVEIYEVNGESFMQIRGWRKHQKIDRPSGPRFPGPDDGLSAQQSLGLANPREASRALATDRDHDHDRDLDRDHEREGAEQTGSRRAPDVEKKTPALRVVEGGAGQPTPGPLIVQPDAIGEASKATKGKRSAPPAPEQALTLAHLLLGMITTNHPTARISKSPDRIREETAARWALTIDKLHRIDGYSWGEISGMITWCQRDSFWRTVILGADNLRDKWDTMTGQRERKQQPRQQPQQAYDFDQVLDQAAKDIDAKRAKEQTK